MVRSLPVVGALRLHDNIPVLFIGFITTSAEPHHLVHLTTFEWLRKAMGNGRGGELGVSLKALSFLTICALHI